MRRGAPFQAGDLAELDERLYRKAAGVVAMDDPRLHAGAPDLIGVRHDCDNVIEPAVRMAEWEAERGYRSTYFVLHTAPYWRDKPLLQRSLDRIGGLGHEIGFHLNALTEALLTGRDPLVIVAEAVAELRRLVPGQPIKGVVAHGDQLCHTVRFVNDELFTESPQPDWGEPRRTLEHRGRSVPLRPVSRTRFGFTYDPYWLPRGGYLSDSGGRWSQPFDEVADGYRADTQWHLLVHPDWWGQAFAPKETKI